MFWLFTANWTLEFRLNAALKPFMTIQTVWPCIRIATSFACVCAAHNWCGACFIGFEYGHTAIMNFSRRWSFHRKCWRSSRCCRRHKTWKRKRSNCHYYKFLKKNRSQMPCVCVCVWIFNQKIICVSICFNSFRSVGKNVQPNLSNIFLLNFQFRLAKTQNFNPKSHTSTR